MSNAEIFANAASVFYNQQLTAMDQAIQTYVKGLVERTTPYKERSGMYDYELRHECEELAYQFDQRVRKHFDVKPEWLALTYDALEHMDGSPLTRMMLLTLQSDKVEYFQQALTLFREIRDYRVSIDEFDEYDVNVVNPRMMKMRSVVEERIIQALDDNWATYDKDMLYKIDPISLFYDPIEQDWWGDAAKEMRKFAQEYSEHDDFVQALAWERAATQVEHDGLRRVMQIDHAWIIFPSH